MNLKSILAALKAGDISAAEAKQQITVLKQRESQSLNEPMPVTHQASRVQEASSSSEPQAAVAESVVANIEGQEPAVHAVGEKPQRKSIQSLYDLDSVAIIGKSGRYPGSRTLDKFWNNLKGGVDCVQEIPRMRWDAGMFYDPKPNQPGKIYCKSLGAVDEPEFFDPLFFNISPLEAEQMDPQFRLFIQDSYHAFEDAGYNSAALDSVKCGVYLGIVNGEYNNFLVQQTGSQSSTGGSNAIGASRIAYYLNLKGPAIAMDTACSSSLIAMHIGCQNLLAGEIDMALAGGVALYLTPTVFISMCAAGMLSQEGRCKTFDNSADGFVPGEGVGTVVLKRLSDAERDNDSIYGVIIASGSNQDGKTNGITAPSKISQINLARDIYQRCNIDPASISYVDMHGTGTKLGDPIELEALATAYSERTSKQNYCAIGSVKSNIGHASAAAGVASVHKVLLQMQAGELVPSLHFNHPNEHFDFQHSPFYVSTKNVPWEAHGGRRRAAVSSFGYSGTNVHLVIEEYPNSVEVNPQSNDKELILISAQSDLQLRQQVWNLFDHLEGNPNLSLSNVAHTLRIGRDQFAHRLAFVAASVSELAILMEPFLENKTLKNTWFSGESPSKHQFDDLDENPKLQGVIRQWLANKEWEKLAEFWVRGITIPWSDFIAANSIRKISLPGYSFSREAYWPQELSMDAMIKVEAEKDAVAPAAIASTPTLAPKEESVPAFKYSLLQRGEPTSDGINYLTRFSGDEFFFTDHKVQGRSIFPAVGYLDMACEAVFTQLVSEANSHIVIKNVAWLKPFYADEHTGNEGLEFSVKNKTELGQNDQSFEFVAQANGVCCQGIVVATNSTSGSSEVVSPLNLDELRQRCTKTEVMAEELYAIFSAMGLHYGPAYQGVQNIQVGQREILSRVILPVNLQDEQNNYVLHPALMDAVLQTSLALPSEGGEVSSGVNLPFALDRLIFHFRPPAEVYAWIRPAPGSSSRLQKLDVDICDANGRVCVQMRGFSSRLVKANVSEQTPAQIEAKTQLLEASEASAPDTTQSETNGDELNKLVPQWQCIQPALLDKLDNTSRTVVVSETPVEALNNLLNHAQYCHISPSATIEDIQAELSAFGSIERLIWCVPVSQSTSYLDETLLTDQESGVRLGYRLVKALLALNYGVRALQLVIVTEQSQAVSGADDLKPAHASVHGFIGSLCKEYHSWLVRSVDVGSAVLSDGATDSTGIPWSSILRLNPHPFGDTYAYRSGEWFQRVLLISEEERLDDTSMVYRQQGVYVVVGGAGGIGGVWTEWMIRHYQAQVVWLGRRAEDDTIRQQVAELGKLGVAPLYLQADVADKASLDEAVQHLREYLAGRPINGVVHSAIVLADNSLAKMDETNFMVSLDTKVAVSVRLAQAFSQDHLDWMCFFSSLQSFTKEPGQSNYAAGCTFKDAYAERLNRDLPFPVKTLNWGYWGSIGVASTDDYRERMAENGIGSIEPEEAMLAVQQLLAGRMQQWGLLKTTRKEVLYNICPPEQIYSYANQTMPDISIDVPNPTNDDNSQTIPMSVFSEIEHEIRSLLWVQLQQLNVFSENFESIDACASSINDNYRPWLQHSIRELVSDCYLNEKDGTYQAANFQGDGKAQQAEAWQQWQSKRSSWLGNERLGAQIDLVESMLKVLPAVLTGQKSPTDILLSQNQNLSKSQNGTERNSDNNQLLVAYVQSLAKSCQKEGRKLRILEIGAGTGETSISVFEALAPFQSSVAEYCYTDTSRDFLIQAEERFGATVPYLNYQLLNIEQPPASQGIATGYYDVVIAANALHATSNIRRTLSNTKALLKAKGLLLLNEMVKSGGLITHVTSGLSKDWWLYEDECLRISGCPALAPQTWRKVLMGEGYTLINFQDEAELASNSQVIAAYSDGCVRLLPKDLTNQKANRETVKFEYHATEQVPALNEEKAAEVISSESQELVGGLHSLCLDFLRQRVGKIIKLTPSKIDEHTPLEKYGVDSILSVQLTSELGKVIPDISGTVFFEYQTLDALVNYLLETYPELLQQIFATDNESQSEEALGATTLVAVPVQNEEGTFQTDPPETSSEQNKMPEQAKGKNQDIAIIGMSCRVPMANNPEALWKNLLDGKDAVTEVPKARWDHEIYYDEDKSKIGKTSCKWGSFIDGIDEFDPMFFNISPKDAEFIDPQVRLFLQTSWELMESSAYTREKFRQCCDSNVGVYIGAHNQQYQLVETDYVISAAMSASAIASIPNRISSYMDFCGPSVAVDTFCSSSMIAIHMACSDLQHGEADMAIAGGINHLIHPKRYLALGMAMLLGSDDTQARSFGCGDGFIPSEGVGAVLLKRLDDAKRDNDNILAVIKSTAQYHGGAGTGYGTTNPQAYTKLMAKSFAKANIDPNSISFIESAANGNALSDSVAFSALKTFFNQHNMPKQSCSIGSVKSNFGHLEAASGVMQLIKVVQQLQHRQLPPTIFAEPLNPNIQLQDSPFVIHREPTAWDAPVLRAVINTYGGGGSLGQAIVEEYVEETPVEPLQPQDDAVLILLSARSLVSLKDE